MNYSRWIIPLLLFVSACGTKTEPPEPGEYPVKIPDTTKVSDEATRNALKSFDAESGVLRFSGSTAVLANLKPKDVLVSDVSAAAPFGYLRKVKIIRSEGGEVVVETEPAQLTDAVQSGTLKIEAVKPQASASGPSVQGVRPQIGIGGGIGSGFVIEETLKKKLCIDDNNCDGGYVQVDGRARASIGYRLRLGLEYEVPDSLVAYFEASAGADGFADLNISGSFKDSFKKEERVADHYDVITGSIGPVPIVIVVNAEMWVGIEGSAQGSFNVGARPTVSGSLGVRWSGNNGLETFRPQAAMNFRPPTGNVSAKVHAYTRSEIQLRLYGVFGPKINVAMGGEVDMAFPRDPLWTVWGRAFADIGFRGTIPIIKIPFNLSTTLLNERFKVGDAPIQPPVLNITNPAPKVVFKKPTDFYQFFDVSDAQGRKVAMTGSSSRDGNLPALNHAFSTPGPRTLTLTASNGTNTSQGQINVDAINYPPSVQGVGSAAATPLGLPLFLNATGFDLNEPQNRLDCSKLRWTTSGSDVLTTETGSSFGCQPKISFSEQGARSFTVTATDPEGLSNSQNIAINISARPAQLPPIVDRIQITSIRQGKLQNNQEVLSRDTLNFSVPLDNPDNSPVTFEWSLEQLPRPQDCTPSIDTICTIFSNPRRILNLNQNQAAFDWTVLTSLIPGFKFPTEKFWECPFGGGPCGYVDKPVAARVMAALKVTSSVAPDIVQLRVFELQISPKDIGPS